jgi:hypothetical protein
MLERRRWAVSLSACALAVGLSLVAGTAQAQLLWRDNFNTSNNTMLQNASLAGRLSGSLAGDAVLQSSRVHQQISSNQLLMVTATMGAGRVRFQPDLVTNTSFNWAASSASAAILGAPIFRVESDWTTPSTTTANWISFNIGHPDDIFTTPAIRFNDAQTDYSLLLRGNGGVVRADNSVQTNLASFAPSLSQRHVVFDFAFDSYADGSLVHVLASIDGVQIDNYSFTWNNNSGNLHMELETFMTGMLIDNLQISAIPEPSSLLVWSSLCCSILALGCLIQRRRPAADVDASNSHTQRTP